MIRSTKTVYRGILENIIKRLSEVTINPETALDELAELDPQTALGKAMTDIMVRISNLQLLDYYQGYDRVENTINIYLSKDSKLDSLKALVNSIEKEIETPISVEDGTCPFVRVSMNRSSLDNEDFAWIVRVEIVADDTNEYEGVPVDVSISGDMEVSGKKSEQSHEASETEEEEEHKHE